MPAQEGSLSPNNLGTLTLVEACSCLLRQPRCGLVSSGNPHPMASQCVHPGCRVQIMPPRPIRGRQGGGRGLDALAHHRLRTGMHASSLPSPAYLQFTISDGLDLLRKLQQECMDGLRVLRKAAKEQWLSCALAWHAPYKHTCHIGSTMLPATFLRPSSCCFTNLLHIQSMRSSKAASCMQQGGPHPPRTPSFVSAVAIAAHQAGHLTPCKDDLL
eukprot:1157438-Pelagomonas_calceolata.AAC.5